MNPLSSALMGTSTSVASTTRTASTATSLSNNKVSEKDFLTLLATELKDQNPTKPVNSTQFVAELAQFSQLSELSTVQSEIKSLVHLTQQQNAPILNGAALIGRSVATSKGTGTVESATVKNGAVTLTVSSLGSVSLASVTSVSGTTATTSSTAPTSG